MQCHGREQLRCLKRGAAGKEDEPDACRFLDPRAKVGKAREKAARGEGQKCTGAPAFVYAGAEAASEAVAEASWGVVVIAILALLAVIAFPATC